MRDRAVGFGMLGVFMAQDWSLFFVFWELTLIPLFFLIDQWGGTRRHTASLNFVLYTMGGSVFMLINLLTIFTLSAEHSTSMESMLRTARSLPCDWQIWIFLGFLIGFGVKMPIFPIHGWLPLAHVEAPSPVSILLSGAMLKMGAYGLLKATGKLPAAVWALQPWLAGLALISILYGALLAFRQTDLKAMIAYSSVSHMGVVLLGIAALNETGLLGAPLQMTAQGIRHHLEELNPRIETLGAAGFFGVAMNWRGLDDEKVTPLCPVVVVPSHGVRETPRPGQAILRQKYDRRRSLLRRLSALFNQEIRRNLVSSQILISLLSPSVLFTRFFCPCGKPASPIKPWPAGTRSTHPAYPHRRRRQARHAR